MITLIDINIANMYFIETNKFFLSHIFIAFAKISKCIIFISSSYIFLVDSNDDDGDTNIDVDEFNDDADADTDCVDLVPY